MAATLPVFFFALVLASSQANECVSKGFGCLPQSDCPQEARLSYGGCSTVCCDLSKLTGCKGKGGECNLVDRQCKELPGESASCGKGQKCCVWLH
ncbi:hypothetical protein MTO96_004762 [Rhipicephalus appendiculatus]|uniref:Carboxypeptidase inhibitor n=1 Tax=Rhipicephalus appendiculatus TaxID=34631 RepID=A0A131YS70_RHIAP